ncbi:MAG TPA: NAD-dependent epimerase/dehydratase family protein [Candidatus Pacearchaeota archaeon]|nr:NAD-dependent epimerase/dehydratase family protein [Candidatus Pacearchaeota archaeon]
MRILVTGGAGFIGSHIVDRLIKEGHKVAIIDNLSTGRKENINPKAKFYKFDIQSQKVSGIFKKEKPEIVFHLAAQIDVRKSVEDPIKDAKTNILGSLNIIQNFYCQKPKTKNQKSKIIFSSTGGAIYGDASVIPTPETYSEFPLSPYGICKLSVEKYLNYYWKVFGLPYIALRYANVYGPRQNSKGEAGVIAIFIDKMLSGETPVINGDGKQTRDFVFVKDVVEANILAMKKNRVGVYNIGTAKETNINIIFRKLKKLTNSNAKETHVPEKPGEQKRSCLNWQKAQQELSWKPKYDLDNGLKETVEWFKKII